MAYPIEARVIHAKVYKLKDEKPQSSDDLWKKRLATIPAFHDPEGREGISEKGKEIPVVKKGKIAPQGDIFSEDKNGNKGEEKRCKECILPKCQNKLPGKGGLFNGDISKERLEELSMQPYGMYDPIGNG